MNDLGAPVDRAPYNQVIEEKTHAHRIDRGSVARGLHCPPGKRRVEYVDTGGVPGLYVEVRATSLGAGTYYLRYKDVNGKTCHQKIGGTAEISLGEARKEAQRLKAAITLGADPRAEATSQEGRCRRSASFSLTNTCRTKNCESAHGTGMKSCTGCASRMCFRIGGWIRLRNIRSRLFIADWRQEGLAAATANHHIKLIKHALNLAVDWQMLETNPAARVPLLEENNQVESYLDDAQLERLLKVLRTDANRGGLPYRDVPAQYRVSFERVLVGEVDGCRSGEAPVRHPGRKQQEQEATVGAIE